MIAKILDLMFDRLIERLLETQFARREENRFLEITLRSGRKEMIYRSDLLSGAIIASVVERAKAMAIKRAIATATGGRDSGNGPAAGVQCRVRRERHFPDHRYHRRLAQADRLRSRKRRQNFACETDLRFTIAANIGSDHERESLQMRCDRCG